jgi:hypothetical protein
VVRSLSRKGVPLLEKSRSVMKRLGEFQKQEVKRLGVFYGAGHMPELEDYITRELGFELVDEKWLEAFQE